MPAITENRQDTKRALAVHSPSGERYIVEYCSLWRGDECVGTRIVRAAGPIYYGDLLPEGGPLQASPALYDRIDDWRDLSPDDADYLQAEEEAGRLTYPLGAR